MKIYLCLLPKMIIQQRGVTGNVLMFQFRFQRSEFFLINFYLGNKFHKLNWK